MRSLALLFLLFFTSIASEDDGHTLCLFSVIRASTQAGGAPVYYAWQGDFFGVGAVLGLSGGISAKVVHKQVQFGHNDTKVEESRLNSIVTAAIKGEFDETITADVEEQIRGFLLDHHCDVSVGLGIAFPRKIVSQLDTLRFHTILPSSSQRNAVKVKDAGYYRTLFVPYLRGSYLSGVVGGMYVADSAQNKVAVFSSKSSREEEFIKGVKAANKAAVVGVHEMDKGVVSAELFNSVLGGADLVYINAGEGVATSILHHIKEKELKTLLYVLDPMTPLANISVDMYNSMLTRPAIAPSILRILYETANGMNEDCVTKSALSTCSVEDSSSFMFAPSPQEDPAVFYGSGYDGDKVNNVLAQFYLRPCENLIYLKTHKTAQSESTAVVLSNITKGEDASTAQKCLPNPQGKVRLVGLGVFINNVGAVDLTAGSVYIDANIYIHQKRRKYLSFKEAEAEKDDTGACSNGGIEENDWDEYETSSSVEFLNFASMGASQTSQHVFTEVDGHKKLSHLRVQGVHYFKPNIVSWPFDAQEISIVIEDLLASSSDTIKVVFCHMKSFSGVSPSARYFPGQDIEHKLENTLWKAKTLYHCWPALKHPMRYIEGHCDATDVHNEETLADPFSSDSILEDSSLEGSKEEESEEVRWGSEILKTADLSCTCLGGARASSRLLWQIQFSRPFFATFIMVFLPPLTIMIVAEGAWLIRPASYTKRLGICGSSLVSAVLFHTSLSNQTPPTSQPTTADCFMLLVYISIVLAYLGIYLQSALVQMGFNDIALDLFFFFRIWGPISTILSFSACTLLVTIWGDEIATHRMTAFFITSAVLRTTLLILVVLYKKGLAARKKMGKVATKSVFCSMRLFQKLDALEQSMTETGELEEDEDEDDEEEDEETYPEHLQEEEGLTRRRKHTHDDADEDDRQRGRKVHANTEGTPHRRSASNSSTTSSWWRGGGGGGPRRHKGPNGHQD